MGELLLAALGLGLAGLDPTGALIAVGALAAGAKDRSVLAFGLVGVLGTAVWGTLLSITLGARLAAFDWLALIPTGRFGAVLELVLGAVLLGWAVWRILRRRPAPEDKPGRRRAGTAGLLGGGVLFALSATLDPTFVAMTVLAGRSANVAAIASGHLLWVIVSQAPLVFLIVAVARGGHERAVAAFSRGWTRIRPVLGHVVTGALVLGGGVLLLDAGWWFTTGHFLLPDPS